MPEDRTSGPAVVGPIGESPAAAKLRLLIVEDHPLVRHALREVLAEPYVVAGEASGGQEAVQKALELQPDIVILDVGLPDMNGVAAAQRIKEAAPATQVVILTANVDDVTILRAIEAGVTSIVAKQEETPMILQAIEQASSGLPYFSPAVARRVMDAAAGRLEDRSGSEPEHQASERNERRRSDGRWLTARETEILRCVASGAHNRDIARTLEISERTVMNHLMSVYGKLGVRGRAGATAYAIKHRLINI